MPTDILPTTPQPHSVREALAAQVRRGNLEPDAAQEALAARLDALRDALVQRRLAAKSSPLGWLFGRSQPKAIRGLYITGDVGRGKSMLMDLFFASVPLARKRRVHFNAFMADVHERIARQRAAFAAGETREPDPIRPVAEALAGQARLLCFDEFAVTDIADAMILGRLFTALFEQGVVVVATSNTAPEDLYRDGLNRQLFEPFIATLQAACEVVRLDARTDYRLETIARGQAWITPLTPRSATLMEEVWQGSLARVAGEDARPAVLTVRGRSLPCRRSAGPLAWFHFDQLCREARGAEDYLALAARFGTLFLEGVPVLEERNEARRFILLVDTLYDARLLLVATAAAAPQALYAGPPGAESAQFARTASRLTEMASADYAARRDATVASRADAAELR